MWRKNDGCEVLTTASAASKSQSDDTKGVYLMRCATFMPLEIANMVSWLDRTNKNYTDFNLFQYIHNP